MLPWQYYSSELLKHNLNQIDISKEIHLQWYLDTFNFRWDIFSAISTQLVRPSSATYPSLCSTCVTYGTPCHAIGHQLLPTQPCYHKCYGFDRVFVTLVNFLPCNPSCCFQGFPGIGQFNLKISRASCWSSKHSPSQTISLNHNNPQKVYTGRFYLRARTGQLQNINL